jgi:endonuclease/exonuclease/phosphatase family metal-dependent hydrolase
MCDIDGEFDPWNERLEAFADIIRRHDPDLIGLQELITVGDADQILEGNPDYEALYFHDPHGPLFDDYPDATILYRAELFDVMEHGSYFLSDTPDEPWTTGWAEANIWRLVTWAHLRHRITGQELYFATTHFDNNSPNQEMSAPVVLERTEPWAGRMPSIVVGDFNSRPDTEAYATLTQGVGGSGFSLINSFDIADEWSVAWNQPSEPEYDSDHRIDHIFLAGPIEWTCSSWVVDLFRYGDLDRYPSDHFAMAATLTIPD